MNIKKLSKQIFKEIVKDYENEKMIQNKGYLQKTTAQEILGGKDNV